MGKPKKKLTAAQRAAKKQRKKDFETVFMNGKQVRLHSQPGALLHRRLLRLRWQALDEYPAEPE